MAADWSVEVIEAVERWAALTPERGAEGAWRCVGRATPHGDGWLMLDLRNDRSGPDSLVEPCLAGERGPDDEPSYPIDERRNVDGVLILRAPAYLPSQSRYVWARAMSPRFLIDKLRAGLAAAEPSSLAEALAEGRLAGAPTAEVTAPGLLPAQAEAFRACLSPGVRLVWGPPGTGKTRVLASAIEELVRAGKRVLLVSTANVAVDNALRAVVSNLPEKPGAAVRVGTAHDEKIATDQNVQIELLAATASRSVDGQRERVAEQLREIAEVDAEVDSLGTELRGYDDEAAVARLAAERELEALDQRLRAVEDAVTEASTRDAAARAGLAEAREAHDALDVPRRAFSAYLEAAAELARLDRGQQVRQIEIDRLDHRPEAGGWRARRDHRRRRKAADAELRRFAGGAAVRRRDLLDIQARAGAFIHPTTADDLKAADFGLERAQTRTEEAVQNLERSRRELVELHRAIDEARSCGLPSEDDRRVVAESTISNPPARYERLQELLGRQRLLGGRRSRLEKEHRALVDRSRRLRADAETEIINGASVVATTLARSRVHRAIAGSSFDVVLVDEAGAAALAEVLLALCRATTTAVLFGDFLQLGPVHDEKVRSDPSPVLEKWVRSTCFSHVGISAPSDIPADGSCVALTRQFRFGPELRRLANEVTYEVLADADMVAGHPRPETEIVLVDVSTVPDLGVLRNGRRSGKWWMAGVLLSRALAEQHAPAGPVGILAPYRAQAEATLAALRDGNLVAGTAVGTVHSFQGREFPTVVFDLVDDGRGWIARGRRDGGSWEDGGVKVFGVGITRARSRLYLIVDLQGVNSASAGPFRALHAAVGRGEVQLWSAAALLGREEPQAALVDSTFAEVARLLRRTVTVTDIHDEHTFAEELERQLDGARHTVSMWSPWIANRAGQVVPLIKAAVDRGVQVTVFLRPDEDRNMAREWAQRRLPDLRNSRATVIRSDHEHRKLVIIDDERVLIGSANLLSNTPGSTREVMITMEGRAFAERMRTELRVDEIGKPRACPSCGLVMEVRRGRGRRSEPFRYCRPCDRRTPL
jgi:hypothetical protein